MTALLYQHRMAIAVTALTAALLLAAAVTTQLVPAARDAWRSSQATRARRQDPQRGPAVPPQAPQEKPAAPGPAEHKGATVEYADQLAAHRAALTLTDIPIVDDTDTGAAILRVRRHVDDILVALIGDDPQLLAAVRKKANATGQWDGRGLWALLEAEDAEAQLVGSVA